METVIKSIYTLSLSLFFLFFVNSDSFAAVTLADRLLTVKVKILPANGLLGQPNTSTTTAGTTQSSLSSPSYITSDGTHVVISDTGNNRLMIWNSIPNTLNKPADLVLGQANFTSGSYNRTTTPAANTLYSPAGVAIYGGKLIVADTGNSRVLIWNTFPTANGQSADVVLGFSNFTTPGSSASGPSATSFCVNGPIGVAVDSSGALYVVDSICNRALYWSSIPTANLTAAGSAVGQSNLTTSTSSSLNLPQGIAALAASFPAVGNTSNNNLFITNGGTTVIVGSSVLSQPAGVAAASTKVWVADKGNNRVVSFQAPYSNGAAIVNSISATAPKGVYVDSSQNVWFSEPVNNRVLIKPGS